MSLRVGIVSGSKCKCLQNKCLVFNAITITFSLHSCLVSHYIIARLESVHLLAVVLSALQNRTVSTQLAAGFLSLLA